MALYDRIGITYDTTRRADPHLVTRLIHNLAPCADRAYLDLGCGTGNYTVEVGKHAGRIVAIDQSQTMIAAAQRKPGANITWTIANAESLPIATGSLDGAICFVAHHHFSSPDRAFAEVHRVLAPGGRFVVFNATGDQMRGCWLVEYFPEMMNAAIEFNDRLATEERLERAGFAITSREPYSVHPEIRDGFLYFGKYEPARYLNPRVRAGISMFAARGESPDIMRGCARLAEDIESGRFTEVAQSYANDRGDYTFWVARR